MEEKLNFYIVYGVPKDTEENQRWNRTFTKSDVYWFGVDEHKAMQQFRQYARHFGGNYKVHIKCIDLNSLADYKTKSVADSLISELNAKVISPLYKLAEHNLSTRFTTVKDGSLTLSISKENLKDRSSYRNITHSLVHEHDEDIDACYVERQAFYDILEILLDRYMKRVQLTTNVKVNINSKTYKKYNKAEGV